MKLSLLDMTQNILSALDSDSVNSIDDTVEAVQVADLIKEAYFELMSQRDWPFLRALYTLEGLADLSNPTKMRLPEDVNKVTWIKYNKKEIEYIAPQEFKELIDNRTVQTGVVDSNGYVINRDPIYWTSYDDSYIFFDGYDASTDTTLQASKTAVYGVKSLAWTHEDSFVPALPDKFFPTLLAEAKAQAFVNLKQQSNVREERKAQRGRVIMQNESWRNEQGETKYNSRVSYGRK
jgi:hypothetical protein